MRISDWSSDVCSSDLLRARRPDAGVAIGLQLHADLQRVALGLRSARLCLADLVRNAADRLDMVADLVRDDIGLRGVARGAELAVEFAEEGGVEIDALIGGAVEGTHRSEEHTSELQSLMRISYAVFCLKKKNKTDKPK